MRPQEEAGAEESARPRSGRPSKRSSDELVPGRLLKRMAQEVLEHTKQLGLFDEIRMRLLEDIETSKEFKRVQSEFEREVRLFCSNADLSLPRARLRDKLNTRALHRSAGRLEEHVQQVSRRHKCELRRLYDGHAASFLKQLAERPTSEEAPPRSAGSTSSSSQSESLADSGVSSISPASLSQPASAATPNPTVATVTDPKVLDDIPLPPPIDGGQQQLHSAPKERPATAERGSPLLEARKPRKPAPSERWRRSTGQKRRKKKKKRNKASRTGRRANYDRRRPEAVRNSMSSTPSRTDRRRLSH